MKVDQAYLPECVLIHLQYFVVGQVEYLHLVTEVLRYAGEA